MPDLWERVYPQKGQQRRSKARRTKEAFFMRNRVVTRLALATFFTLSAAWASVSKTLATAHGIPQ